MSLKSVKVCLSPALLPVYGLDDTTAVVIDIFRASSSMCYGLANGAQAIIPVAELTECLAYKEKGYLLAAERDGRVVDGFDFGNSPFSYTPEKVAGKTIVLTTTNGTRAIERCKNAKKVVIGSFLNISALTQWLKKQDGHVLLVCAGWKDHMCLEDTVFAGSVVDRLDAGGVELDDAALAARDLYRNGRNDLRAFLAKASHSKRMKHLHIEADIAFCLQEDLITAIPVMKKGKLVCLPEYIPAAQ